MSFSLSSSASRVFAASALALVMTGCATVPSGKPEDCMDESKTSLLFLFSVTQRSYNKNCAIARLADHYSKSGDEGERVLAQSLREGNDKRVKEQADKVRDIAVSKDLVCDVGPWKKVGGKVHIPLYSCVKPDETPVAVPSGPALQ